MGREGEGEGEMEGGRKGGKVKPKITIVDTKWP